MPKPPRARLSDDARWNAEEQTVDFTLLLRSEAGEERIPCRVSGEALLDYGQSLDAAPLDVFRQYESAVKAAVDRKLKADDREPDGSIIIRFGDMRPLR